MILHRNRWLIWTLTLSAAIALSTIAYIEYVAGEIDSETAEVLWNRY